MTFSLTLNPLMWTEVLNGGSNLFFDLSNAKPKATVFYTESADRPTGIGNDVYSNGGDWDFQSTGLPIGQRIWIKGAGILRGVRG